MSKGSRKKKISIPLIVLVLAIIGIVVLLHSATAPYIEAEKKMEDVTSNEAEYSSLIDWDYWLSVNPDIIGWIVVPGTAIDYPIVQASSDDPTFYLTHDVYKDYNIYGCPYVDAGCEGLDDLSPIIYGHHMINDTMFSDFSNMTDNDYAEKHSSIYLHTPDNNTTILNVTGARVINASTTQRIGGFSNVKAMQQHFAEELKKAPMVRGEITENTERVFTFVTCSYTMFRNERTLVYGTLEGQQ